MQVLDERQHFQFSGNAWMLASSVASLRAVKCKFKSMGYLHVIPVAKPSERVLDTLDLAKEFGWAESITHPAGQFRRCLEMFPALNILHVHGVCESCFRFTQLSADLADEVALMMCHCGWICGGKAQWFAIGGFIVVGRF